MTMFVLTRDEAAAVAANLEFTNGTMDIGDPSNREVCRDIVRRLQLEATVRDGGEWWEHGRSPDIMELRVHVGERCPDSFTMTPAGLAAIIDLLPEMIADEDEMLEDAREPEDILRRRHALMALATRLGVGALGIRAARTGVTA
jgi:hypothetical protein